MPDMKETAKTILKNRTERRLWKADREHCKAHPDWTPLTAEELGQIRPGEKWSYTLYKNMYGSFDADFVTDGVYQAHLLPLLNSFNYAAGGVLLQPKNVFSDKNYQELFVPQLRYPHTVFRRINGVCFDADRNRLAEKELPALLADFDRVVVKESLDSGHGQGVRVVQRDAYESLLRDSRKNYVVQSILKQHESLARYNESSVNVIRVTTVNWRGEVYVLGGILRVGVPGAFCDLERRDGVNPRIVPIREDGTLEKKALDCDRFDVYADVFGKEITGCIPRFAEMKGLVKEAHRRYVHHAILGWDLTLDEDGEIVCIEYNPRVPGIVQTQCALGPVFRTLTADGKPLLGEIRKAAGV